MDVRTVAVGLLAMLASTCWAFDGFSSGGRQIVPSWTPEAISFQNATGLISNLDRWYAGLDKTNQRTNYADYNLNRNRLFLVAQEKRLADEAGHKDSAWSMAGLLRKIRGNDWMTTADNLRTEAARDQLKSMKEINKIALNSPDDLRSRTIAQISDVQKLKSATMAPGSFSGALSQSLSKAGMPAGGGFELNTLLDDSPASFAEMERIRKAIADEREQAARDSFLASISQEKTETQPWRPSAKETAFLKDLGIPNTSASHKGCKDLSNLFPAPQTQWDQGRPNAKCSGHAIASDIAATLNRKRLFTHGAQASPEQTYGILRMVEDGYSAPLPHSPDYCNLSAYGVDPYTGVASMIEALKTVQTHPVCPRIATELHLAPKGKLLKVDGFAVLEEKPISGELIKEMIDRGLPPIVQIDTDARDESGDWLQLKRGGRLSHVINVAGYCEDIDPRDLRKKSFFIVRDSLGTREMHYKIAADNLETHMEGVYKIKNVKAAN
jgi:hypothetical protein